MENKQLSVPDYGYPATVIVVLILLLFAVVKKKENKVVEKYKTEQKWEMNKSH